MSPGEVNSHGKWFLGKRRKSNCFLKHLFGLDGVSDFRYFNFPEIKGLSVKGVEKRGGRKMKKVKMEVCMAGPDV